MHSSQGSAFTRIAGILLLAWLMTHAGDGFGAEIDGVPQVLAGDTLVVAGKELLLAGVDSPAPDQPCYAPDAWACGEHSARGLEQRIDSRPVRCIIADSNDEARAVCYLDELELNHWVVIEGWGLEETPGRYAKAQRQAIAAERGIWLGGFEPTPTWIAWASGRLKPDDFSCGACAARKKRISDQPRSLNLSW